MTIELTTYQRLYFTGIKGVGMTALACIAKDYGMEVAGSDVEEEFVTDKLLAKKHIPVHHGFDTQPLETLKPDMVVYTAAHNGKENPQVQWAMEHQIPVLTQGEALGLFFDTKYGISVAGVGGKTTTTALMVTLLKANQLYPSFLVGSGEVSGLTFPGAYETQGQHFVTEADEYACAPDNPRPKFYYQHPQMVLIPNLAFDHPDIYPSEAKTLEVFAQLINRLPADGHLIINLDAVLSQTLLKHYHASASVITYGVSQGDWRVNTHRDGNEVAVELVSAAETIHYRLSLPGQHNALNAAAAILGARQLGVTDYTSLAQFAGVERRFQKLFEKGDALIYDDYAHHPDEIKATIAAARSWFVGKKIIVLFQPHTYSRTKALFDEFSQSFDEADTVVLIDIFASAREKTDLSVSSERLAQAIRKRIDNLPTTPLTLKVVAYGSDKKATLALLKQMDLTHAVIFTMGAGDIYKWATDIATMLPYAESK